MNETNERKKRTAPAGLVERRVRLLKPCPFCGSSNIKHQSKCGASYVMCADCEAYGPMQRQQAGEKEKRLMAVNAWENRHDLFYLQQPTG